MGQMVWKWTREIAENEKERRWKRLEEAKGNKRKGKKMCQYVELIFFFLWISLQPV